jgi:hypothetical protein
MKLNQPAREDESRKLRIKEWKDKTDYWKHQSEFDEKIKNLTEDYIRKQNNA